jgi:hypothetical protein
LLSWLSKDFVGFIKQTSTKPSSFAKAAYNPSWQLSMEEEIAVIEKNNI